MRGERKDKVSHLAQASILLPFPSFYAPYSWFAVPLPFLHSTFLFVDVVPCALGAIPLVPRRYHPSLSSRYSCVFGAILLVPRRNYHSWRSLSYLGIIVRIWDVSFSSVLPICVSRSRCIPLNFLAWSLLFAGWLLGGEGICFCWVFFGSAGAFFLLTAVRDASVLLSGWD